MSALPCPKCAEPMTLDQNSGMFRCANCGFRRPEMLEEAQARIRARGQRPSVRITYRGTLDHRARSLFESGQVYLWRGDTAAALDAFQDAIDIQRDFVDAHLWIAKTSDDPRVQRDHLGEIIAHDPGHLEALRLLLVLDGKMTPEEAERSRAGDAPVVRRAEGAVGATAATLTCPVCGGDLTIDEVSGRVLCKSCGYAAPLPTGHASDGTEVFGVAMLKRRAQAVRWIVGERILHCNNCGAERTIPATRLSARCPFCGSNQVVQQDALQTVEQPDGLVPFAVNEDEAKAAIRDALKGVGERLAGLFDDNRVAGANIEGVYLPFWIFDALVEVSKTTTDRRTSSPYQRPQQIKPYQNIRFTDGLMGIRVPAVEPPPESLTTALDDFDTGAAVAYNPMLLARYPAQLYSIDFEQASLRAQSAASDQMRQRHGESSNQNVTVNVFTSVRQMTFTLLLLPVWVATLYERDGDIRPALVNGQTGKAVLGKARKPTA